jgi:putative tryptophan/tyrosine transport system substrate-binding protein
MRLIGLAVILTLGLILAPLAAEAQQARVVKIGWLLPDPKPFAIDPFLQRLKELGWSEGGNLVIEQRYSHGTAERYLQLADELLRLKVDALGTRGAVATRAAQRTSQTIPIVFVSGNPVAQGFVESLSHPRKNLTGVAIQTGELTPKRVQLLKEAVTGMVRLAILEDSTNPASDVRLAGNWQAVEAASRQLGIRLVPTLEIRKSEELDAAFARAVRERAGGVLVLASPFFSSQGQRIASLAANARLPAIYEHRGFVEAGGLMSYGPDHRAIFSLVADYVDKILRGAQPADLPVEQPTKFEWSSTSKLPRRLA